MELIELARRHQLPAPWSEGDNIPWNDPAFSARMLNEHLSQEHDAASRRLVTVDRHVAWIHNWLLAGRPTRILDLGCGPGLYANRLARLGHECTGIDYSPASIEYAREAASREELSCIYVHEDIRLADYGSGYGLVMLIFGEFNVFKPADAAAILDKANRALAPDALLLLEPHTYDAVERMGHEPRTWRPLESGLFSERPHLYLEESHWDGDSRAATIRYDVIDARAAEVTPYAQSVQAYSDDEYCALLARHGFEEIEIYPSLAEIEPREELIAIVARKQAAT